MWSKSYGIGKANWPQKNLRLLFLRNTNIIDIMKFQFLVKDLKNKSIWNFKMVKPGHTISETKSITLNTYVLLQKKRIYILVLAIEKRLASVRRVLE